MRDMLEHCEDSAREKIAPWEHEEYGENLLTAGVGFYYFEGT
jgi:MOSC domain-containing protein YiiM